MDYEKKQRLIALRDSMKEYGYADGVEELESIFPELTESEDERIRQKLIRNVSILAYHSGLEVVDLSAWLEKHKPVEYLDKDKVYAIMTKLTNLSQSQLIPTNSDEFKKLHEITSEVRDLLEYPIEQKPSWSEEDEKHRESILKRLDGMCKKGATFTQTRFAVSEDMDWLKSLPNRFTLQPKQGWSEEDEAIYKEVLHNFESVKFKEHHYATGKFTYAQVLAWLKSLRPSWKPSEEQMSMLLAVIRDPNNAGSESCHLALESLYEQLKKL